MVGFALGRFIDVVQHSCISHDIFVLENSVGCPVAVSFGECRGDYQ
jgi:hypothetical protein